MCTCALDSGARAPARLLWTEPGSGRHGRGWGMSGWFQQQIVHTGRLPLFCFFAAALGALGSSRLSVRLIRAKVRWWPRNVVAGQLHVHHMVFGVVFMGIGGVAELAAALPSLGWRAGA